jgi:hypothetical protein
MIADLWVKSAVLECIAIVDLSQIVRDGPYLHDNIKEGLEIIFFFPYEIAWVGGGGGGG